MGTDSFLGSNVVDIGSCDSQPAGIAGETARTGAGGGDGSEVIAVGGVSEVEGAGGGYGVAEALGRC